MSIAWEESLSIGHAEIDADHRRLIALVNALERAAVRDAVDCARVGRLLAELTALAAAHFAREEAVQRTIGFSEADTHRRRHDMVLRRLRALEDHFAHADADVRRTIARTLANPLAVWLVGHITNEDVRMREYVDALAPCPIRRPRRTGHHAAR